MVDLDAFLAELDAWAKERDPGWETLAYGDHPDQVADLRHGGERCAILLHGGFWRPAFTRANTRALAVDLALRGWTTWNVEYRRSGVADTLADVEAALEHVHSGRVALNYLYLTTVCIGHSAGGHLALWAAGTGAVDRVVSLAGVTDLARAAREGIGANAAVEFAGAEVPAAADPMRRLPLAVPALLVHGTDDDRVPVDHARRYAQRATAAGDDCRLVEVDGDHFMPIDPRSTVWPRVVSAVSSLSSPPAET